MPTRPQVLEGITKKLETGSGTVYLTANYSGNDIREIFVVLGKSGSEERALTEGISRLISTSLQNGVPLTKITKHLRGISSEKAMGLGPNKVLSVPDAVGRILERIPSKFCNSCQDLKSILDFGVDNSMPDRLNFYCKECRREMSREHYKENRDRHLESVEKYRNKRYRFLNEYKANKGCENCGEKDPRCLHFHHKDPEMKEARISALVGSSWERLTKEVEKCTVLCANCHARYHHSGRNVEMEEINERAIERDAHDQVGGGHRQAEEVA